MIDYLVITPFFPSNDSFRGSYLLDQTKAIQSNSNHNLLVIILSPLLEKSQDEYMIDGIQCKTFKVIDFPSFIFPSFFNKINLKRFGKFLEKNNIKVGYKSIIHGHINYPSLNFLDFFSRKFSCKTILQHHGLDILQNNTGITIPFIKWIQNKFILKRFNRISEHILSNLSQIGIKNHLVKRLNMREQIIKLVEIIPIEFIVRNVATGSITKRLGIEDGTVLKEPLIEYCLKDDKLGDPLISEEHILAFDWASKTEIDKVKKMILRINDFMIGMFRGVGIKLIDFKLEFGRIKIDGKNEVILADEISPDTCRLWDSITEKKLDKDRFRKDLGDLIPAYTEVAKRLGILHEQSNVSAVNVTKLSSVKRKKK